MQTSEEKIALSLLSSSLLNSQLFSTPPSLHNNFSSFAPLDEIFTELLTPRDYLLTAIAHLTRGRLKETETDVNNEKKELKATKVSGLFPKFQDETFFLSLHNCHEK